MKNKFNLHPASLVVIGYIFYTIGNALSSVGQISECTGEPYGYDFAFKVIFVVSLIGLGYIAGKYQNEN